MAMAMSRRWALRVVLPTAALAFGGLVLGLCGLRVSCAEPRREPDREIVRQVTVFAIVATPGGKTVDSELVSIQPQLSRLLPHHGFKLLDAQSPRIVAGESVECDLGHGYTAETTLVRPIDENGKVQLRCELFLDRRAAILGDGPRADRPALLLRAPLPHRRLEAADRCGRSVDRVRAGGRRCTTNRPQPADVRPWGLRSRRGRPFATAARRSGRAGACRATRFARVPGPIRRVRAAGFRRWSTLDGKRAVPGPCPRAASPSLDATAVPGRCSVVPDRFGFPTDMGCIGPAEGPTARFFRDGDSGPDRATWS